MAAAEKGSLKSGVHVVDQQRKAEAKSLFQGTKNVKAMAKELFKSTPISVVSICCAAALVASSSSAH